jgi:glucokinase
MSEFYIGVDLGGTFTKTGIMEVDGEAKRVFGFTESKTPTHSPDALIDSIVEAVRTMLKAEGIEPAACRGLGIGAPGPLNRARGVILHLPNIPGMANLALRDRVGEAVGVESILENDANAAAMGEYLFGAGRDVQSMIMLTPVRSSTGHTISPGRSGILSSGPKAGCVTAANMGVWSSMRRRRSWLNTRPSR